MFSGLNYDLTLGTDLIQGSQSPWLYYAVKLNNLNNVSLMQLLSKVNIFIEN